MITVSSIVEQIIRKKPFLEEAINNGIINLSALARQILPEVKNETFKDVQEGAVLMALKRRPKNLEPNPGAKSVLEKSHDLIVRSNLSEFSIPNADFSAEKHQKILKLIDRQKKYFLTATQGVFETTIIFSSELFEEIKTILNPEKTSSMFENLSSITIRLPGKTVLTLGVYYSILKLLAWEGINVVEVVSTFSEFTIILENKEVARAFSVLKNSLG